MGGGITFLTPRLGFEPALQVAGLCVAVLAGVGGMGCVIVASRSHQLREGSDRES